MASLHKHRTIYQEKASRYISSHPKFYLTLSDINPHSLSHEIHEELHEFDSKAEKQTSLYNHLRTETTNFLSSYHTIQEKKEKDNERIKDKKLKSPFLDLINQYISRGYKIPDLSSNKNLFAPSILLSEPDKIVKLKEINASKDLKYLKRIKNAVNKKNAINKKKRESIKYGNPISVDDKSNRITPKNVQSINFFKLSEKPEQLAIKTPKEIENENLDLKSYNAMMSNCIKEFENDMILSQNRSRNFRTTTNASFFPNKNTQMRFEFPNILQTEPNKQFESPFIGRKKTTNLQKKLNLFGNQPPQPKLIKSYNKCINILKNKTKQINNTLLNSPVNSFNLSESKTNNNNNTTTITSFTDVINKGIKQNLLTMDFSKKREFSGDPVEFMTMIQKTKKNIINYNFDNIKKIAMSGDSHKGKEMIDKIVHLDDKIMKMDKALIKSLENCKV